MQRKETQTSWFIQWKDYFCTLRAIKVSLPRELTPAQAAVELLPDLIEGPGLGDQGPSHGQYWLTNSETGEEIPVQIGKVSVREDLDLVKLRERARATNKLLKN